MNKWFLLILGCFFSVIGNTHPLPSKQIFQASVRIIDPNTFALNFEVKPNYFLYSDRIRLTPQPGSTTHLGTIRFPPTINKTDKQGHIFTVYRNQVSIPVAILGTKAEETSLTLNYQGCSDDGFCYAPEERFIQLTINDQLALSHIDIKETAQESKFVTVPAKNKLTRVFESKNWLMILLTFYGFGLLLSFTPCILPMVPVLSGIIVGHGKDLSTSKAFFLSLSYVLSMSVTYALVGATIALLGANLQISMQSPWSVGLFSLIFVLLALSMFGFYEFKLPHAWQAKIGNTTLSQRGGHYLGAAIMGSLSTLILSPCVTAPLIGVLTYIAQTKNVFLGSITLFVLSLGMGTPLLLIGTSAGKWLPETGSWMNTIKCLFGVLFIGVAILLISRILPAVFSMVLWASLFIFSGIYCGALTYSTSNREKFNQSVGLLLLAYGFLILFGASKGATNPIQPLTSTTSPLTSINKSQEQTLERINKALNAAQGKNPVMLDFYADWCNDCKIIEATTFRDPRIQKILEQFVVIKVDVTRNTANNKEILNYFNVVAPPTFVFFDAQGRLLDDLRLIGEHSTDKFLATLNQVKSN